MSQAGRYALGSGVLPPIETLTPDNGNTVGPDGGGNIDVLGGANSNGAINIQTDGNPYNEPPVVPLNTLRIRLTDSILLPDTSASGAAGVIAMGSTSYTNDRVLFKYNNNLFCGYQSGNFTVGLSLGNTGIGNSSMQNVSTGRDNTCCGQQSLQNLSTANECTAVGIRALNSITTSGSSTAVGYEALFNSTVGGNTAIGRGAMLGATTANSSVALGYNSLSSNNVGNNNVAIGYRNQNLQVGGSDNVTVGTQCLSTTGAAPLQNTAVGSRALENANSNNNTSFGYTNLVSLTTGSLNHSGGAGTLGALTTGSQNSACGAQSATLLVSGDNNIFVGYTAGNSYTTNESSNIIIGNSGSTSESHVIRVGTHGAVSGQQSTCYIAGIRDVNTITNQKPVVINSVTSQLGISDGTAVGQTLTGDTGGALSPTAGNWNILGGVGCTVNGSGSTLTINIAGGGDDWSVISANQTAVVNNGYFCNKAGTLALALPATSVVGDVIEVANINTATGVQFIQSAGQRIFISGTSSTLGATGTLTSSAVGDSLKIVCGVANTLWYATSMIGSWTPA